MVGVGLCSLFRSLAIGPTLKGLQCRSTLPLLQNIATPDIIAARTRTMRASRRIRGYPRPLLKNIVRPEPSKYGYLRQLPEDGIYTTEKLPIRKLGGRDPVTGRVVVRTIGGGSKRYYRWVDNIRHPLGGLAMGHKVLTADKVVVNAEEVKSDEPVVLEEKVVMVRYDPCRTADIALVINGDRKRWVLATENIKVGDIIRSTNEIPRIVVRAKEGDAYPLGALPAGCLVHNIEKYPGAGGIICRAAGASAQVLQRVSGRVILQLTHKEQISLNEKCIAVVGKVSNTDRMTTFYPIGSPNRLRRLGKRPVSGMWHRKDGYCGRKIKGPKPVKVFPLTLAAAQAAKSKNKFVAK